jgi:methyl halide transferase
MPSPSSGPLSTNWNSRPRDAVGRQAGRPPPRLLVAATGSVAGLLVTATGSVAGLLVAATGSVAGLLVAATGSVAGSVAGWQAGRPPPRLLVAATGSVAGLLVAATGSVAGLLVAATGSVAGSVAGWQAGRPPPPRKRRENFSMSEAEKWEGRYQSGDIPWDTGRPSSELQHSLAESRIAPGRAIELGCGTGTNAVWLATAGFDVTAVDISALAIEQARERARQAGVTVRFLVADLDNPPAELQGPFDFFFDRGCYHVVRRIKVQPYLDLLGRVTRPGAVGLVLTGNAREPHDPGPPVVSEEEIRAELGSLFEIVRLREFRFDLHENIPVRFLGWSCLLKRPG